MNSYQNRNPYPEFSPARQNYSLSVEDIAGARPRIGPQTKTTHHYEQKLAYQNPVFAHNQQVYENLYNTGKYHAGSAQLPSQKKHFNAHHDSEIQAFGVLHRNEAVPVQIHNVDFPRNLTTDDIPGAKPGTLQSKTVKNHDLANKMREGKAIEDSLDRFQQEKRNSSPYTHNYHNLYAHLQNNNNFHYSEEKRESTPNKPVPQLHEEYVPRRQSNSGFRSISAQKIHQQEEAYSPQLNYPYPDAGRMSEVPMQRQSEPEYSAPYVPKKIEESYQPPVNQNIFAEPKNNGPSSINDFPRLSQNEVVSHLSQDILQKQAVLEKKMYDAVKARSYNIISGYPSQFHAQKNAYGATIQSMRKNNEQFPKQEPSSLRSWNPNQQPPTTISHSHVDLRRDPGDNAGKLNDYAETNYRYANKITGQSPLQDNQMYGIKALKNLSGVRLY